MRLPVLLFSLLGAAATAKFTFGDDADLGRECHPGERANPGIKFFFNRDRMEAYPFYYKGCGGDAKNRFATREEARKYFGIIMDYFTCPGWAEYSNPCGHALIGNCSNAEFCMPTGFPFPGVCCDTATAERFRENRKAAKCAMQQQAVQRYSEDGQIVFGQNCSHNFCQNGAKCVQDEFEAYCCMDGADSGHDCTRGETGIGPGIRYYHDKERDEIYPFYYRGCGGSLRHGATRHDIDRYADFFACPGFVHYGMCLVRDMQPFEKPYYPESVFTFVKNCTGDFHCLRDPMMDQVGHCCSKAVEARYRENKKATKCHRYDSVVKYPGTNDIFFGRKCSDNFCPKGSKCIQEEFEAYCCANEPDLGRECYTDEKGEKAGIRYFLDDERNVAYPFFYQGCGGNKNRFPNATAARNDGNPDWVMCLGFVQGEGVCKSNADCKKGFFCSGTPNRGKCCSESALEHFVRSIADTKCPERLTTQKDKDGYTIYGRNCSHDFCERGAECIQGEYAAHCCVSEPDPGHKCGITEKGTTPGIRWYFDFQRVLAYPFYYKGCGGDSTNRFNHYNVVPHPESNGICPGFGLGRICGLMSEPQWSLPCPEDQYCHPHRMHSTCCSTSVKNRYIDGIHPNHFCPKGFKGLQADPDNSKFTLLGKSCGHNFCQAGSVCVQEEFAAYCCLM